MAIVTVHDLGSVHGGLSWSNPRHDDGCEFVLDAKEHEQLSQAIVAQVGAWAHRPKIRMTYEFNVRETWRIPLSLEEKLARAKQYFIKIHTSDARGVLATREQALETRSARENPAVRHRAEGRLAGAQQALARAEALAAELFESVVNGEVEP